MSKLYSKPEEAIELLKNLLNFDLADREAIAREFHGKKSDLAVISMLLQKIDLDTNEGKFKPESIKQPIEILSGNIEELRKVSYNIYPKLINFIGLISGLKHLATNSQKEFGLEIRFDSKIIQRVEIEKLKEIAIYKICIDLIEYFALLKNSTILLSVNVKKNLLEICLEGLEKKISSDEKIKEKLNIIKGRLIWQNCVVLPETHWENHIKLNFELF